MAKSATVCVHVLFPQMQVERQLSLCSVYYRPVASRIGHPSFAASLASYYDYRYIIARRLSTITIARRMQSPNAMLFPSRRLLSHNDSRTEMKMKKGLDASAEVRPQDEQHGQTRSARPRLLDGTPPSAGTAEQLYGFCCCILS
ncbi:hypothetical protein CERZMDRAFT_88086 [Cercospora zeae-maydis SCOH1-5]|uniref:Uncharacterized protein n=1 Tax=Cercospora zeae-maydis SCOH1-5 TaxID=717836 RepID=A0A6A6F446_9PEZI|nr:hypothetical protein CERZMDRAFT_88086 [Cercospora zeae-maydis SCOH1-5]